MAYDLEELRKEFEEDKNNKKGSYGDKGDLPWYKLPDDTTEVKLRFLPTPTESGKEVVGKLVYKHYSIPEQKSITCYKTWGMKCPMCEMLNKYRGRLELKDWEDKAMSVFNVLVANDRTVEPKVPQILTLYGDFTYRWVRDFIFNDEVGDITDVRKGSNVVFQRVGFKSKFNRTVSRNITSIGDETEIVDILSKRNNLDNIWRNPDEKYLGMIQTAAKEVEKEILKVLEESGATVAKAPITTVISDKDVSVANDAKKEESKTITGSKPADAKECFGAYRGDKECDFCAYDFECRKSSDVPF